MTTLDIDGNALSFEESGSGAPPLALVHGLACANEDWREQVSHFSPSHRVLRHDQRGHGRSSAFTSGFDIVQFGADLAILLDSLRMPPALLVGHSLGCRVVLECARAAPQRVAGLVLIDGSRLAADNAEAARRATLESIRNTGYDAFMSAFFAQMFTDASDARSRDAIVSRARRLPETVALELMPQMVAWDSDHLDDALAGVRVPLTVVQSTYLNEKRQRVSLLAGDRTPWLDLVSERVPHAVIEIVPDVGHFSMLEAPRTVNGHIEETLERVAAA